VFRREGGKTRKRDESPRFSLRHEREVQGKEAAYRDGEEDEEMGHGAEKGTLSAFDRGEPRDESRIKLLLKRGAQQGLTLSQLEEKKE